MTFRSPAGRPGGAGGAGRSGIAPCPHGRTALSRSVRNRNAETKTRLEVSEFRCKCRNESQTQRGNGSTKSKDSSLSRTAERSQLTVTHSQTAMRGPRRRPWRLVAQS
eukprot:3491113-Prymnesium_polylepis.1